MRSAAAAGAQVDAGDGQSRAAGRPASAESLVAELKDRLGEWWPPRLYRERILPMRTRSHEVPAAPSGAAAVEVLHTLLGVELKVGRRRISCPDLATARYLSVFARAGVPEVAVPYDITKISHAADELESAWQRTMLLADHLTEGRSERLRSRLRTLVRREIGREIREAGAGTPVPQFRQDTRQRPRRI